MDICALIESKPAERVETRPEDSVMDRYVSTPYPESQHGAWWLWVHMDHKLDPKEPTSLISEEEISLATSIIVARHKTIKQTISREQKKP